MEYEEEERRQGRGLGLQIEPDENIEDDLEDVVAAPARRGIQSDSEEEIEDLRVDSKSRQIQKKPKKFQINRGNRLSRNEHAGLDSSDDERQPKRLMQPQRRYSDDSADNYNDGSDDNVDLFNKKQAISKSKVMHNEEEPIENYTQS